MKKDTGRIPAFGDIRDIVAELIQVRHGVCR
jgi:hypothetical protein